MTTMTQDTDVNATPESQRAPYPPIDMCQMAFELGRIEPSFSDLMLAIIAIVKDAEKYAAPFDLLRTLEPTVDSTNSSLRVPHKIMLLAVTVDIDGSNDVITSLWIPAKHGYGKIINRHFQRPPDIGNDLEFHWMITSIHGPERYEFGARACVVPHSIENDTIMAFAPYKEAPVPVDPSATQDVDEMAAVTSITAMAALLKLKSMAEPSLESFTINCGTEPEFAQIQTMFGKFSPTTWDLTVVLEPDNTPKVRG